MILWYSVFIRILYFRLILPLKVKMAAIGLMVVLVIILTILVNCLLSYYRKKKMIDKIHGPRTFPIIGNVLQFYSDPERMNFYQYILWSKTGFFRIFWSFAGLRQAVYEAVYVSHLAWHGANGFCARSERSRVHIF